MLAKFKPETALKQVLKYIKMRARMFKTNDIVKISNVNILNLPIFFVEKMWETFAVQKLLSFCQQKISVYLVIKS